MENDEPVKYKKCSKCNLIKIASKEYFRLDKRMKLGFHSWCRTCQTKQRNTPGDKARARNYMLNYRYGINTEIYKKKLEDQNYSCAICLTKDTGKSKNFHNDHNHSTKENRGLLCLSCNTAIGKMEDNKWILMRAIEYLERHKK